MKADPETYKYARLPSSEREVDPSPIPVRAHLYLNKLIAELGAMKDSYQTFEGIVRAYSKIKSKKGAKQIARDVGDRLGHPNERVILEDTRMMIDGLLQQRTLLKIADSLEGTTK